MSNYNTRFELNKIKSFLDSSDLGVAQSVYGQVIESVNTNIRWMDKNFKIVKEWLLVNKNE